MFVKINESSRSNVEEYFKKNIVETDKDNK